MRIDQTAATRSTSSRDAAVLEPSHETLALRDRAREFAQREVRPVAAALDSEIDPVRAFSWDLWRKASREGWRTAGLPAAHGGLDLDVLAQVVLLEEFTASGDVGFAAAIHMAWKLQRLLLSTEYLRREVLPMYLADEDFMLSLGMAEPDSGTDNTLPYDGSDGGARTTAVQQPDGDWVINGTKWFIQNAGLANGTFVLARTDAATGMSDGATVFYVDHSLPGFSFERAHSKMGMRLVTNGQIHFDDVRVPDAARISDVGNGVFYMGSFGKAHAPATAALAIGIARDAFEQTELWCKSRRQAGRPLIEHEAVATKLADMYADIEIARTMAWKAAWSGEHDPNHDVKRGMIAQLTAGEVEVRVCRAAMQIWGAQGYLKGYPIEKLMRDALFNNIDANDLNRLRIARSIRGGTGGYIG